MRKTFQYFLIQIAVQAPSDTFLKLLEQHGITTSSKPNDFSDEDCLIIMTEILKELNARENVQ